MELKPKPAGRKSRNSAKLALPDLMDNRLCREFLPKKAALEKDKIPIDKGAGVS
jgi:hypothetical protein